MKEENKEVKVIKDNEPKKKQAVSLSYATRQFGKNIDMLKEAKLIDKEDLEKLKGIQKKLVQRFLGYDLHE